MSTTPTGAGGDSAPLSPQERLQQALSRSVLNLETVDPEPRFVTIDGVDHRLSFYDDFSLLQHARFSRLSRRADELGLLSTDEGADEYTDEQAETLAVALDDIYGQMVRLILPTAPDDALARLSFHQKRTVHAAFLATQAERNVRRVGAPTKVGPAARATGGTSSRRSAPATATGATGSRKRRSASSSPPTATSPG